MTHDRNNDTHTTCAGCDAHMSPYDVTKTDLGYMCVDCVSAYAEYNHDKAQDRELMRLKEVDDGLFP